MQKVEIKVNVINEMMKLKNNAYADRLAWVEELVQNSQRAKAKNVKMRADASMMEFEDDGDGCTDPAVLFEKSQTGWGADVIESDEPFGEGFFSVMMISDLVVVESIGFEATFDVAEMFRTRRTDCIKVVPSDRTSGFKVTMMNLDESYSRYRVEERFKRVAQFIDGIKFTWQDQFTSEPEVIEHKEFTTTDGSPFAKVVQNELFEGWLRPFSWGKDGYSDDKLFLFAQSREVKEIYSYSGMVGVIHAKSGVIDLRSPDRKDVIQNDNWNSFSKVVSSEVKEVLMNLVREGGDTDLDKYESVIDRHLSVEEYAPYIRFVKANDDSVKKLMARFVEMVKAGVEDLPSLDELAELIAKEEAETGRESAGIIEEMELTTTKPTKKKVGKNSVVYSEEAHTKSGSVIGEEEAEKIFFVEVSKLRQYKEKVALAEYYDIPIVLVRNNLERKVLEMMGASHIESLSEKVELTAQLKKVGAVDTVEERAMFIFKVISRLVGSKENLFKIGDMEVSKEIIVGSVKTVERTEALAVARGKEIFIDRKALQKEGLEPGAGSKLKNTDRAFIANNMEVIAHELSHVLCGTTDNTQAHAEAQVTITNRILAGMF